MGCEFPGVRRREAGIAQPDQDQGTEDVLVFVCDEDEREISRQMAPGSCPYCGGMVQAVDVESQWRFCFLPVYFKNRRRLYCSFCNAGWLFSSDPPSSLSLLRFLS
ncbi:uncharacterized protein LOC114753222 [Neltuma alba]|uniref:uncharacterized protein LOC114753222 n=1 Tax=Neltuma alba TaxID=207710 RepID=UPI0010A537A6|nr:uncharacterized protein LOC114753222 [Prosopis alba]